MDLWQEEFRWILDEAVRGRERWLPLEAEDVAVLTAAQAGIPPRAIARVVGETSGQAVSRRIYSLKRRLGGDASMTALAAELGLA